MHSRAVKPNSHQPVLTIKTKSPSPYTKQRIIQANSSIIQKVIFIINTPETNLVEANLRVLPQKTRFDPTYATNSRPIQLSLTPLFPLYVPLLLSNKDTPFATFIIFTMNQNTSGNNYKKRNDASPQKSQTSIVIYTNQKAQVQKKQNSNITPPRSAIERSQTAILGIRFPPQANKSTSNNPYHTLSLDTEEDDEQGPEDIIAENKPQAMNSEEESSIKEDAEDVESLETESSTPERKSLSKKAQQMLRKIRSIKKSPDGQAATLKMSKRQL